MTNEQYERWKDFALRMCRTQWDESSMPPRSLIEQWLTQIFTYDIEEQDIVACIQSWDHSDPYPEGHCYHRVERTRHCGCRYPDGYMAGDKGSQSDCGHCGGSGENDVLASPYCMADIVTEWSDFLYYEQRYWPEKYQNAYDLVRYGSWSTEEWSDDMADDVQRAAVDLLASPVRCCLRAGLDCACEPSMGVMGFTAGDIRRMYPEGVPDWVKGKPEWETVGVKGVIPGVGFVPDPKGDAHSFDDIADDEPIWI